MSKYLKITRPECPGTWCVVPIGHALSDEFDGAEPGDIVQFELLAMTEEEFRALPEFRGW